MTKNPLTVSIIVPVYNPGKRKLNRCVNSLIKQTYSNIRIILVDDGSKDGSEKACDELKQKDDRIVVIHQKNQGSIAARRNGLLSDTAQRSDYVCYCDSDDTMTADAVEKLVHSAVKYNADYVCGRSRQIKGFIKYVNDRECFHISEPKFFNHDEIISRIYLSCFGLIDFAVSFYPKLYKTEKITKAFQYNQIVKFMGEDLEFTLRFLPTIDSMVLIPDVIYNYYYGGITSKFMPYAFDDFLALYNLKEEYAKKYFKDLGDPYHFMNNEMMWVTRSRFVDCRGLAKYTDDQMLDEIKRVCEIEIVRRAAAYVATEEHALKTFAGNIHDRKYNEIFSYIKAEYNKGKLRRFVKKFLSLVAI